MRIIEWIENGNSTPVPDIFIDKYMAKCEKAHALVYILACRYASAGMAAPVLETAEKLSLTTGDVLSALKHFEAAGLVSLSGEGAGTRVSIVSPGDGAKPAVPVVKAAGKIKLDKPPVYQPDLLERMQKEDAELRFVFASAERLLGRMLTYRDLNALATFYDYDGLSADVISLLIEYCIANCKTKSIWNYMGAISCSWSEDGINTVEEAEAELLMFNKDFRDIMRAFGYSRRDPARVEIKLMKKWLRQYKMPVEMIAAACDKTVMQTGQPKWAYADAILTKWDEAGVRSVDDLKNIQESLCEPAPKGGRKAAGSQPAKQRRAKAKFSNYEHREWDYDKLLELEQMRIDKELSS